MPIVRVQMFPGRSTVQKEFLARAIVDAMSEIAGSTREGVHVIIDEVSKENWANGPRLYSNREAAPLSPAGSYVSIGRVSVLEGKHDAYLAWRRNSVFPFMASHDGFLGSTLLAVPDDPNQYVIINKWTSQAAEEAYKGKPRETELRAEAKEFLAELFTDLLGGEVVTVFNPRTQTLAPTA